MALAEIRARHSRSRSEDSSRCSGFTLFEMLVAVALFALMAMLAYGGLDRVLAAREAIETEAARWRDLEAFFVRLQDDLNSNLPRTTRNVFGVDQEAFKGNAVLLNEDDANLWLVRSIANSSPQRIGYRMFEDRLELLRWDELDAPERSKPSKYTLFKDVKSFKIEYLDATGLTYPNWPNGRGYNARPAAIHVELVFKDGLDIERFLLLP